MKKITWLAALAAAVFVSGCSDDADNSAGPAAGLYVSEAELSEEFDIFNVGSQDLDIELPPEEMGGVGIVAANGQAAFIYVGDFFGDESVSSQVYYGPVSYVYWGNVSAQQPAELPEAPATEVEFLTGLSGNFQLLQNMPISFEEDTGLLANVSLQTGPLESLEDDPCYSFADSNGPIESQPEDFQESLFYGVFDLLDPEEVDPGDPTAEGVYKAFCAAALQDYNSDEAVEEVYGLYGGSFADLIGEYELESDVSDWEGYWVIEPLLFGPVSIGALIEVDENGSFEMVDGYDDEFCDMTGQFSTIDENYNVYRMTATTTCNYEDGTYTSNLEALVNKSGILSEIIDEAIEDGAPCGAGIGASVCSVDAQTHSDEAFAIAKISFSGGGESGVIGEGLVLYEVEP